MIDKPQGFTSHDVVSRVRRVLNESSIGHLGTLDPMATGVLPLLLGKFTRLAQFFSETQKSYTGTIRFGYATDTYDAEGEPTSPPLPVRLTIEELRRNAAAFRGEIEQMPPQFSAKKVAGKPAYKSARAGQTVTLRAVKINVLEFEIRELNEDLAEFFIRVSAGGYVRSVAHDLGKLMRCGAHLASLCRVQAGPFSLCQSIKLTDLEAFARDGSIVQQMPHPRALLPELPSVTADEITAGRLRNGMAVNLPEFSSAPMVKVFRGQAELLGIATRIAGTLFQPKVVLG